jgi:tellurite resistance protein TehA-like permease
MLWLVVAAAITVRTIRRRLPFTLTWWSFTFPVGTCVTGTIALASRSGAVTMRWATVPLYALLLGAWLVVAVNTARGSATGCLFRPTSSPHPEPLPGPGPSTAG